MNLSIAPFSIAPSECKAKPSLSLFSSSTIKEKQNLSLDILCEQGVSAAERGEMGKALNLLLQAVSLNKNDHRALEMIAQIHLIQGRPYGAALYAQRSIDLKPDWCEGFSTLARAQREMGEVTSSLKSYQSCISLFNTMNNINEKEKNEIQKEYRELNKLYNKYKREHGDLQGRAHVVDNIESVGSIVHEFSSMKETWKEEIKQSVFEMKEREEENDNNGDMDEEESVVC